MNMATAHDRDDGGNDDDDDYELNVGGKIRACDDATAHARDKVHQRNGAKWQCRNSHRSVTSCVCLFVLFLVFMCDGLGIIMMNARICVLCVRLCVCIDSRTPRKPAHTCAQQPQPTNPTVYIPLYSEHECASPHTYYTECSFLIYAELCSASALNNTRATYTHVPRIHSILYMHCVCIVCEHHHAATPADRQRFIGLHENFVVSMRPAPSPSYHHPSAAVSEYEVFRLCAPHKLIGMERFYCSTSICAAPHHQREI